MVELVDDLASRTLKLPESGPNYKAQNPLYAFYISALLSTGKCRESLSYRLKIMASKPVTVMLYLLSWGSTIDV